MSQSCCAAHGVPPSQAGVTAGSGSGTGSLGAGSLGVGSTGSPAGGTGLGAQLAGKSATKRLLSDEHKNKIERRAEEIRTRVVPDLPPGLKADLRP